MSASTVWTPYDGDARGRMNPQTGSCQRAASLSYRAATPCQVLRWAVGHGSDRGRSTPAGASKKRTHRRSRVRGQGDGPTVTQKWPGACPHPVQPRVALRQHNPSWGGGPGAKASIHSPHLPPFVTERLRQADLQSAGEQDGSQWGQRALGCKHNREPSKFLGTRPQSQRDAP